MDIQTLLRNLRNESDITRVMTNPRAQFGLPSRQYLGATVLPERVVNENAYREESVKYRTIMANDGTRYSPVTRRKGALVGAFEVFLAESDTGAELTSQEYDTLLRYLGGRQTMEAIAQLINFLDVTVNRPLIELNEKHRWEAIVDAVVQLRGDNSFTEDVTYSNPAGHRAAAGAVWSNNATDPMEDINAQVQVLTDKGFSNFRFITSRNVVNILLANAEMKKRGSLVVVDANGQIQGTSGRLTRDGLNEVMNRDGFPNIETYDLRYRTQTGTERFLKNDVFVIIAGTGRDESLDLGDDQSEILPDTLGYLAVGRAAGQSAPGRVAIMKAYDDKPPRIDAQGWQTSLPVITEPEAIATIHTIS